MGVLRDATTIFLLANPITVMPFLVNAVKGLSLRRKKQILFREALISLLLAYLFLIFGGPFTQIVHVEEFTIRLSGGIIIFLLSVQLIFPHQSCENPQNNTSQEPFIVPIAIPLICGAGVFAAIVLVGQQVHFIKAVLTISLAWIPIIFLVVASAFIHKLLGKKGMIAMEQLSGMFLMMISVDLFLNGMRLFFSSAQAMCAFYST